MDITGSIQKRDGEIGFQEAGGVIDREPVICSLLEDKLSLCKKIVASGQILKEVLVLGNINQIAGVIAQRQEYMDAVDQVNEAIMRLRPHKQPDMQTKDRSRMKSLLSDIKELLQRAIPLNHACERVAAQILELHRVEITQIQNTRQAYYGYGGGKSSPARFFDVKT